MEMNSHDKEGLHEIGFHNQISGLCYGMTDPDRWK